MASGTVARVRFRFKVVGAGSPVAAKDFSVSALIGTSMFAVLAYVRTAIMHRFSAVAEEMLCVDFGFDALDALSTMITVLVRVSAFLKFTSTSKAYKICGTNTVPSFTVFFSEEFEFVVIGIKWVTVPIGGPDFAVAIQTATDRAGVCTAIDRAGVCCLTMGQADGHGGHRQCLEYYFHSRRDCCCIGLSGDTAHQHLLLATNTNPIDNNAPDRNFSLVFRYGKTENTTGNDDGQFSGTKKERTHIT
jgi:hypothetical protein